MFSHSLKLIIPVSILSAFSLVVLASIDLNFFWNQLIWVLLGFGIIFLFHFIDIRNLLNNRNFILFLYLFSLVLLIAVFFSPPIRGIPRWIVLGPLIFQPSELARLSLLLLFSYFFAKRHVGIAQLKNIFIPLGFFLIPAYLIIKQPDLSSFFVLLGLWAAFIIMSGIRLRHLFLGLGLILIAATISWSFVFADYQKERITSFLNPDRDPLGANYNVIQSKIAIGSGGWLGKGFGQGTQVQLGFLPEAHNDFILSSVIEEWGIVGGLAVISAFLFLMWEIIYIGRHLANNNFDRFFCLGAVVMFTIYFFINSGTATGLSPATGLPFPFLSYGGSSLLINFFIITIINSIALRS